MSLLFHNFLWIPILDIYLLEDNFFQILKKTQEYHFDLRYHRRYIEGIPKNSRLPVSQRPKKTQNKLFDEENDLNYIGNNLFD